MNNAVILWGCGQMAEVAFFYLTHDSLYRVAGFCMDGEYIQQNSFHGLPVVPFENIEEVYSPSKYSLLFLISYDQMNTLRSKKYQEGKKKGYHFISYVSSKATYYGTPVGENTFIMENNVIQPYTSIGKDVIMWSGNHMGHHSKIEDHCFITSHVVISGSTVVGEGSFLGVNATLRDNIKIGKHNLIGAGAVVLSDTEEDSVYVTNKSILLPQKSYQIRHI